MIQPPELKTKPYLRENAELELIEMFKDDKRLRSSTVTQSIADQGTNQVEEDGSLWSTLAAVAARILPKVVPMASKVASKVLPRLATGALTSLGSFEMEKKIRPRYSKWWLLVPQNKIDKLITYRHLLTPKQKQEILNALQTGNGVVIKPTKKQSGGAIGAILASIGIPLLLNALTGKGLQAERQTNKVFTSLCP